MSNMLMGCEFKEHGREFEPDSFRRKEKKHF